MECSCAASCTRDGPDIVRSSYGKVCMFIRKLKKKRSDIDFLISYIRLNFLLNFFFHTNWYTGSHTLFGKKNSW